MTKKQAAFASAGALALTLVGVMLSAFYTAHTTGEIKSLVQTKRFTVEDEPQKLIATWEDQQCIQQQVITCRHEGESNEDFANRHNLAVDALAAVPTAEGSVANIPRTGLAVETDHTGRLTLLFAA